MFEQMISTIRKLLDLLDHRERWRLTGIVLAVVGMALMEVVSIASIMPFLTLLASPSGPPAHSWVAGIYGALSFEDYRSFLILTGTAVLALLAVSNAYAAFTTWKMLRFVWDVHNRVATELMDRYLRQPYTFFLNRHSAGFSQTILTEVFSVMGGILVPGMLAFAKAVVTVCVLGLLLVIDPMLAVLVIAVFGGAYALTYLLVRQRQSRLGQERVDASAQMYKLAGEAFGGIKEVLVLGRGSTFVRRFRDPAKRFSDHMAVNQMVGQLPKFALETVAFGGIVVVVLYLLAVKQDVSQVLPIVGVYAFAGYRLMPALQQVFSSLTQIRFSAPALDRLHLDWTENLGGAPEIVQGEAVAMRDREPNLGNGIQLHDVTFTYAGAAAPSLRGISLQIGHRTTVAFVGQTGSGKTTLVDVVLGLLWPQEGFVAVDGRPITPATLPEWKRRVGYVPQEIFLCDDTIRRNIAFGIEDGLIDDMAVERAARVAHLHDFLSALPTGYETVVGERGVRLSGGQRQRIGIARALYHDPDVLIMDEATSALDGITEDAVMQAIRELTREKTIIVIAHRLATVTESDVIYFLEHGRIVAEGTYEELLRSNLQFRSMAAGGLGKVVSR